MRLMNADVADRLIGYAAAAVLVAVVLIGVWS
jgi:hypothetical protein